MSALLTYEEHIVRILGEATEPLFPSEITYRLNQELGRGKARTMTGVVMRGICRNAGRDLGPGCRHDSLGRVERE